MQNANTPLNTIEIKPQDLKAGDQFQPMFNDNVYTCKSDYDTRTMGVIIDGPDYCGHCTFFSDDPNTLVHVRLILAETKTETQEMNHDNTRTLEQVYKALSGINMAIYLANFDGGTQEVKDALKAAHAAIEAVGDVIANQDKEATADEPKQQPKKEEPMTFEQEMEEIARLIGNKYRPTTLEWHVLNYIIEVDHGDGMGPDTKELRQELEMDGNQLGGVLTSLQNKGLVEISDSSRMIGVGHDITHPADELKRYIYETAGIAIGNY